MAKHRIDGDKSSFNKYRTPKEQAECTAKNSTGVTVAWWPGRVSKNILRRQECKCRGWSTWSPRDCTYFSKLLWQYWNKTASDLNPTSSLLFGGYYVYFQMLLHYTGQITKSYSYLMAVLYVIQYIALTAGPGPFRDQCDDGSAPCSTWARSNVTSPRITCSDPGNPLTDTASVSGRRVFVNWILIGGTCWERPAQEGRWAVSKVLNDC